MPPRAFASPAFVEIDVDVTGLALESAIRAVGLPCVIKPVDLAASRGVIRADTMAEATEAVQRTGALLRRICAPGSTPPLLVEAYVDGVEVALEGLLNDGVLEVIALFDKPDPLRGPFFEETLFVTPSRLDGPVQDAVVNEVRGGDRGARVAARPDPRRGAGRW